MTLVANLNPANPPAPAPVQVTTPTPTPTPIPATEPSLLDELKRRLDDQSRIIAGLQKKVDGGQPGPGARPGEGDPPPKRLEGVAAIEEIERRAMEREERTTQKAIRTSILSAMVMSGLPQESAAKLIPAMQKEGKFEIKEDSDEVIVNDGSGARPVSDFVRAIFLRDDWRALVPVKAGARPIPRSSGAPQNGTQVALQPKEDGSYSASAIRAAAGLEK